MTALIFSRYRAFRERHVLSLPPVVLVIGKNGSGKSIISRLPIIIAQAVSLSADGPIDLNAGDVFQASSFLDLVNSRSALPFSIGATVSNVDKSYTFEVYLRHVIETRSLVIEKFELHENSALIFAAEIASPDELLALEPRYKYVSGGGEITSVLKFSGILPLTVGLPTDIAEKLDVAYASIRAACPMPSYLGPFRQEPYRAMRTPNQNIRSLGSRGEHALDLLADDRLRKGGRLSQQVSDWFVQKMGQEISVDVSGEQPRVKVVSREGIEVGLEDTGAGFSQCLPVVVQHLAFRAKRLAAPILIVEQPELHLHPGAHGEIADLIVDSSLEGNGEMLATSIVETHSEQIIMRVRRRIAERGIGASVTLISVGHQEPGSDAIEPIRQISFDSAGNPDAWPEGVFEEAFKDLAAMRDLY